MELVNTFEVSAPLDRTWATLTDLERLAPSVPGADLVEIANDEHRGTMTVEVGPMTATYEGTARIVERDDAAHRAVIDASGLETSDKGRATALITATLNETDDERTAVKLVTELLLTGRMARLAPGVLGEVSRQLIGRFVEHLERDLLGAAGDSRRPDEASVTRTGLEPTVDDDGTKAAFAPAATPDGRAEFDVEADFVESEEVAADAPRNVASAVRIVDAPEAEAVDLLDAGGASGAKRALPAVALGLVVLLILRARRRSRRG